MSKIVKSDIVDGAGDSYLRIYLRLPQFVLSPLNLRERIEFRYEALAPLLLYLLAALFGVYGNGLEAHEPKALWLAAAFCLWLLAELVANKESLRDWVASLDDDGRRLWLARALLAALWLRGLLLLVESLTAESALRPLQESALWFGAGAAGWLLINAWCRRRGLDYGGYVRSADADTLARSLRAWLSLPAGPTLRWRIFWLLLAVFSSVVVWENTSGNRITPLGMTLWFGSALFWSMVFAPRRWNIRKWARGRLEAYRAVPKLQRRLVLLALLGIFALGASFRLTQIDSLPVEMLDADHRGPIVAAHQVSVGDWFIMMLDFQAQEPMHYYFIAAFAKLTGAPIGHTMIKLVSALASLTMMPIMFWLGVELAGRDRRKFGLALGLMACALVAVSFWHVIIARYATRTHLGAPFAALALVFLIRAIRDNQRSDFILLGLALGFGWYAYATSRALPIAAAAGIGLAMLIRPISGRERVRYLVHSAIAGLMFFVVALPYYHFSQDHSFYAAWQVTWSLFSERPGEPIMVDIDAFLTQLMANYNTSLGVFHFDSIDGRHYQALPGEPTLDPYTGAFLILGMAALGAWLVRRRHDAVLWLLPLFFVIMMLPATLHIAYPINVPSNTHTAGAMPVMYLVAALPIAVIAGQLAGSLPRRLGAALAALFCIALALLANQHNTSLYFDDVAGYVNSPGWSKRHMGKTMSALVDTDVPWGNLQIVHTRGFEFDTRNPYIEGGVPDPGFSSGSVIQEVPRHLDRARRRTDRYRLNADKDLVFFYASFDEETPRQLSQWFPQGYEVELRDAEYMSEGYMLFRAPAPGEARLNEIIALYAQ